MRSNQKRVLYLLCLIAPLSLIALTLAEDCIGVKTEVSVFTSKFQGIAENSPLKAQYLPASLDGANLLLSSPFQYIVHTPISINGDADFLAQAAAEGWAGTGTAQDPIMITNYNISSSTTQIDIRNTQLKFQIRTNFLAGVTQTDIITYAISLENVTGGMITDNILINNYIGIRVISTQGIIGQWTNILVNNIITNNDQGIWIESVNSINMENNTIRDANSGISLRNSHFNALVNNVLLDNQVGTYFKEVKNSFVSHNRFYNNDLGMRMHVSAFNNPVQENDFIGNSLSVLTSQVVD
ncbi:MAG: nitrous oxide reductase family maturation protein NosD, partial [Candidatus Hodarchaeota archaeon]